MSSKIKSLSLEGIKSEKNITGYGNFFKLGAILQINRFIEIRRSLVKNYSCYLSDEN